MDILYKYLPFEQARYILHNNCLPLGHFSYYNDPYECNIGSYDYDNICALLNNSGSNDYKDGLIEIIKAIAKEENWDYPMTDSAIQAGMAFGCKYIAPYNLFIAALLLGGSYLYGKISNTHGNQKFSVETLANFFPKVIEQLSNTYTSCFTKELNKFLMWSHYADSHKGIVIGFNMDALPFKDNKPQPMDYSSKHYIFKTKDILSGNIENCVTQILLKKNKEWKDENEYRFIFDAIANRRKIVWYGHNDNPIIKLGENAIKSVCMGYRVSLQNREQLKRIVNDEPHLKDVQLQHCVLSKDSYNIVVESIPNSNK